MATQSFDPRRPALLVAATLLAAMPGVGLSGQAHGAAPLTATEGPDTLLGAPEGDDIRGLGGADSIRGMEGDDMVNGNAGDDTVGGGPGSDMVRGGRDSDMVNGGQGDDTINGDRDNDTLTGGLGADRFQFDVFSGDDMITDFDSAGGDRIEINTGATYTLEDSPQGVLIKLNGGGALRLAGVPMAAMGTWEAPPLPTVSPTGAPTAPVPPSKLLLGFIVALAIGFVGLLSIGLARLVRGGRRRD